MDPAATTVFLIALVPVLMIGALVVELLVAHAPRRGKRPDVRVRATGRRRMVRVVAENGARFVGTPRIVIARLGWSGFLDAPKFPLCLHPQSLLDRWEAAGRIVTETEWR